MPLTTKSKYCWLVLSVVMHWKNISNISHVLYKYLILPNSSLLFIGAAVTLGHIFKEPATINYPFEKGPLSPRWVSLTQGWHVHTYLAYFYFSVLILYAHRWLYKCLIIKDSLPILPDLTCLTFSCFSENFILFLFLFVLLTTC